MECKYMRRKGLFLYCTHCGYISFKCNERHQGCSYYMPKRRKICPYRLRKEGKVFCVEKNDYVHCNPEHYHGCHYYHRGKEGKK